jgi:hypothetical protein
MQGDDLPRGFNAFGGLIMTFLCFGTPYSYLRQINEFLILGASCSVSDVLTIVDAKSRHGRTDLISERWKQFVDVYVADWTDTNLVVRPLFLESTSTIPSTLIQAAVLASGAVALLAIPGLDNITQIFGLISTIASLASLIVGLLNTWQHQHESHSNTELNTIVRPGPVLPSFPKTLYGQRVCGGHPPFVPHPPPDGLSFSAGSNSPPFWCVNPLLPRASSAYVE